MNEIICQNTRTNVVTNSQFIYLPILRSLTNTEGLYVWKSNPIRSPDSEFGLTADRNRGTCFSRLTKRNVLALLRIVMTDKQH